MATYSLAPITILNMAVALLLLSLQVMAAPSHHYGRSNVMDDTQLLEQPLRHLFLPIEVAPAALMGALSAHVDASSGSGPALSDDEYRGYPFEEKRTTSGGMKRKMYWQPLGYMPASARVHLGSGGNGDSSRASASSKDGGSNVFRYG